jgi:magnesium chelatase family protein
LRSRRYATRVSGPLHDRIDLHLSVPAVAWRDLVDVRMRCESSDTVRRRVIDARETQRKRLDALGVRTNAEIPRTIADLEGEVRVEAPAMTEALAYRRDEMG